MVAEVVVIVTVRSAARARKPRTARRNPLFMVRVPVLGMSSACVTIRFISGSRAAAGRHRRHITHNWATLSSSSTPSLFHQYWYSTPRKSWLGAPVIALPMSHPS